MTEVLKTTHDELPADGLERAAGVMDAGGLALIPTETVYGLSVAVAACPFDGMPAEGSGYRRIFSLKERRLTQTVPWLVGGEEDLDRYGRDVDPRIRVLAEAFWPGALTVVVPSSSRVPVYMQAADGTVALRNSSSPVVAALIRACGCPLATTSSNTHGMPAPASFDEVEPRILEGVDIAIDAGATPCRDASTIVAVRDGDLAIIRQGALREQDIRQALDQAGLASRSI